MRRYLDQKGLGFLTLVDASLANQEYELATTERPMSERRDIDNAIKNFFESTMKIRLERLQSEN